MTLRKCTLATRTSVLNINTPGFLSLFLSFFFFFFFSHHIATYRTAAYRSIPQHTGAYRTSSTGPSLPNFSICFPFSQWPPATSFLHSRVDKYSCRSLKLSAMDCWSMAINEYSRSELIRIANLYIAAGVNIENTKRFLWPILKEQPDLTP